MQEAENFAADDETVRLGCTVATTQGLLVLAYVSIDLSDGVEQVQINEDGQLPILRRVEGGARRRAQGRWPRLGPLA